MNARRIIVWLAGLVGLGILLLLAGILLLPRALDSHAVRDRIGAFVLSKTEADVAVGQIDLTWFPRPAVTMRDVSVGYGKQIAAKVQSITVRPAIAGLLRGHVDISRVEVAGLGLSLTLPEDADEPLDVVRLEVQLRTLISSLTAQAPRLIVVVSDGAVDLRIGERPPLTFTGLNGRLAAPPDALDIRLTSRSNVFDSLRLELSVAGDALATTGRARFERLRLPEALTALSGQPLPYLESGDVNLDVTITSVGFRKVQADIDGAMPSVTLVRGPRRTVVDGITLKAVVHEDRGTVHAVVERLDVGSPRVRVTGELTVDEKTFSVTSRLTAREVDLSRVRASALEIAQDTPLVEDICRQFKGGEAPSIGFRGNGRSWAELWQNASITATLRGVSLSLPKLDLDLTDVDGSLSIAGGLLDVTGMSARSGQVHGTEGTLRLGLTGPDPPFELDMKLEADAAELRALLLRAIDDANLHRTLLSIHGIGGRLSGRLVLGDRLSALTPKIFVSKAVLNASYDPIPYPLSIEAGTFEYGAGQVALAGVRGTVGQSSFSELTGTLRYRDSPRITVESGRLSIDAAQAKDFVSRLPGLPPAWQRLEDARGRLDVTALSFEGPLDDPAAWSWSSAGTFVNIAIRHADLPGILHVSGGTFRAIQNQAGTFGSGQMALAGVHGTVGPSSFSGLTGTLHYRGSPRITVESGRLSIDAAQAKDFVSRLPGLPPAWQRLEEAQGRLDVTALSFEGPLDDPAAWSWSSAGTFVNIAIRHADLPGILHVSGGTFRAIQNQAGTFGSGQMALAGVRGTVGPSSFSGLTGTLHYRGSPRITVESGRLSIDAAQAKDFVSRLPGLPPAWQRLEEAQGRLDVTALSFEGALDDPAAWSWSSAGTFVDIAIRHTDLPGVLHVSGGTFRTIPTEVAITGTTLKLLDTSVTVGGSMAGPGRAPLDVEVTGTGSIGAEMIAWLTREIDMPGRFTPRAPVQITDGRLRWKESGDLGFQGDLVFGGGPRLAVELVRGLHALEVRQATITDRGHTARMTLELGRGKAVFSFTGILEQATLDRMFEVPPLPGIPIEVGLIEGDLEVSASVEAPVHFRARGRLAGRDFRVPVAGESVHIDAFDLEAGQDRVDVRSADLRWRDTQVAVHGRVQGDARGVYVDMDVSADRVIGDELGDLLESPSLSAASGSATGRLLPPAYGVIRVKVGELTFGGFTWRPLHASTTLTPQGARIDIDRAEVCEISTVGTVEVASGEIGLDLTVSATDGPLDSASACLTRHRRVTGLFSLQTRLAGRGSPGQVGRALSGEFEFRARDGQFLQAPAVETVLEATFDYLNNSGDFDVAFPDLHKESFSFRRMSARGRVDGLTLVVDEIVVESPRLALGGRGRVDFENDTIDARGVVTYRIPGGRITGRIPVVGSLLSGQALGIPMRVTGSLSSPDVRYLSATDVGVELLSIPMRILGLPRDAIRMFTPGMRRR